MAKTEVCDHCQQPDSPFFSGVPGVFARVQNGKLIKGTHHYVDACHHCNRYPDQSSAIMALFQADVADGNDWFLMSQPHGWEEQFEQAWLQTVSGRQFHLLAPKPEMVDIEDIAIALSRVPRFAGHTRRNLNAYSVAQHSMHVAELLEPPLQLVGLLHDAPEYVLCDLPRPLKRLWPEYKILESRVLHAITDALQLDMADFYRPEIGEADVMALAIEKRDVMLAPTYKASWPELPTPRECVAVKPSSADKVAKEFLKTFKRLRADL